MHLYEVRSLPLWIQPIFLMKYGTNFVIFGMIHQHAIFFMNCHFPGSGGLCAGLQPGFMVQRGKIHFQGGKIFVFIICSKQFFSGHNKVWGTQKIWGSLLPNAPPWLRAWLCVNHTHNGLNWLSEFCFRCHNISAREVFQLQLTSNRRHEIKAKSNRK